MGLTQGGPASTSWNRPKNTHHLVEPLQLGVALTNGGERLGSEGDWHLDGTVTNLLQFMLAIAPTKRNVAPNHS